MTIRHNLPMIGVLGLGDLGSQLVSQISDAGLTTLVFDTDAQKYTDIPTTPPIKIASTIDEVLEHCDVVHWAIPSSTLAQLPEAGSSTIILHDSVMHNSLEAIEHRADREQFTLVHWLMNDAARIFVADGFSGNDRVIAHAAHIGLEPKLIASDDHDVLMARTQGIFALLSNLGLADELNEAFLAGDLTPSANELRHALLHRESKWTTRTIDSILDNPKLRPFVEELAEGLPQK